MKKHLFVLPLAMMAILLIASPLIPSLALAHGGVADEPITEQPSQSPNENRSVQAIVVGSIFAAVVIGYVVFRFMRKQQ